MAGGVLFYAAADVHYPEEFGAGAWKSLPALAGDVQYVLANLVDLCLYDSAPLALAGDVLDGPDPDPRALAEFFRLLRPLAAAGLPVYYIRGNHERGRDWLAAFGDTAVCLDGRVVVLPNGATLTGLSYTDPAAFPATVAGVPPTDVGLYHQKWTEWGTGGSGMSVAGLPGHRLAVCGDVHVRGVVRPRTGPLAALSPGPLVPQSVAEFAPAAVFAVGPDLVPREVPVRARACLRFDVGSPAAADACLTALGRLEPDPFLPEHLRSPLVAVRLSAPVPELGPALKELAAARGFVLRVMDAAVPADHQSPGGDTKAAPIPGRTVLAGAIETMTAADPDIRVLALAVTADGADPAAVLAAARADYEADLAADPPEAVGDHAPDDDRPE